MKIPARLASLVNDGLIDEVYYALMSGKEAQVFVVRANDEIRCAKVYKEANKRSFKQAVQYQEGRTVRNSRRARAMAKGTRYGQKEAEEAARHRVIGRSLAECRSGSALPPRRGRCTCPQTLLVCGWGTGHGIGSGRRGRTGTAVG